MSYEQEFYRWYFRKFGWKIAASFIAAIAVGFVLGELL